MSYLNAFRNAPLGARKLLRHLSHLNVRKYQDLPEWIVSRGVKRVENMAYGHPLWEGGALFGLVMSEELKPRKTIASFADAQLR